MSSRMLEKDPLLQVQCTTYTLRTTESMWLEKHLQDYQDQPLPWYNQVHHWTMPLRATSTHLFKYLQGWWVDHFPGQPVPALDNPDATWGNFLLSWDPTQMESYTYMSGWNMEDKPKSHCVPAHRHAQRKLLNQTKRHLLDLTSQVIPTWYTE